MNIKILELDRAEREDIFSAEEDIPFFEDGYLTEAGEKYYFETFGNLCKDCSPTGETKFVTLTHCRNCGRIL